MPVLGTACAIKLLGLAKGPCSAPRPPGWAAATKSAQLAKALAIGAANAVQTAGACAGLQAGADAATGHGGRRRQTA
jgi:hypothetical protein